MEKDKFTKIAAVAKDIVCRILIDLENLVKFLSQKLAKVDVSDGNLKKRIISSLIMIPFAFYAIYFSKELFLFFGIAIAILMVYEWVDISKRMGDQTKWRVIGFLYILIPIYCVIRLRFIDSDIVFWMFLIIWTTDISAYFVGKIVGGKKLAPSISPGKTWSGMYGALAACACLGLVSSLMFTGGALFFMFIAVIISLVEQASDLVESKFKRIFGVKDSGNIIPGHGGVLDRIDGMMLVAPFLLILVNIFPRQFGL